MNKQRRQLLFWVSIIAFAIASPLVVIFSLGYTYDFNTGNIVKTGSLRFGTNVSAQISINDERVGNTSFITKSFSKGGLIPQDYNIKVTAEGFQSWQKTFAVEAGVFTDFSSIVLLPTTFEYITLATPSFIVSSMSYDQEQNVIRLAGFVPKKKIYKTDTFDLKTGNLVPDYKPNKKLEETSQVELLLNNNVLLKQAIDGARYIASPDASKIIWFNKREIWVYWFKDTGYQPFKKIGDNYLIAKFDKDISDVQWYKDKEHIIVHFGNDIKLVEIDDRGGAVAQDIITFSGQSFYDPESNSLYFIYLGRLTKVSIGS